MNYLNNYFQKGVVAFIIMMLLVIPNMRGYSSIGSYQSSSPAILANSIYDRHTEKKTFLAAVASVVITCIAISAAGAYAVAVSLHDIEDREYVLPPILASKTFNEDYMKYDFAQFDN